MAIKIDTVFEPNSDTPTLKYQYSKLTNLISEAFEKAAFSPGVWQGVRKLAKGLPRKRIIMHPSRKNDLLIPCEGNIEARNCLNMEFDPNIVTYRTQPFSIYIPSVGSYTPDVIYKTIHDEFVIRELKFSGVLEDFGKFKKYRLVQDYFIKSGYKYELITEKTLNLEPVTHSNQKYLYKASHFPFSQHQIDSAIRFLRDFSAHCTIRQFRAACVKHGLPTLTPEKLLIERLASFEPEKALTEESLIWLSGEVS